MVRYQLADQRIKDNGSIKDNGKLPVAKCAWTQVRTHVNLFQN